MAESSRVRWRRRIIGLGGTDMKQTLAAVPSSNRSNPPLMPKPRIGGGDGAPCPGPLAAPRGTVVSGNFRIAKTRGGKPHHRNNTRPTTYARRKSALNVVGVNETWASSGGYSSNAFGWREKFHNRNKHHSLRH